MFLKRSLKKLTYNQPLEVPMMIRGLDIFRMIREKGFIRKVLFWNKPGVDTTSYALHTLWLFACANDNDKLKKKIKHFVDKKENKIKGFVFSCFDPETGGFFQTRSNNYPTLYAIHSILGLIKCLDAIKNDKELEFSKPIGVDKVKDFFDDKNFENGDDIVNTIIEYVKSCYCYDPKKEGFGGFTEEPKKVIDEKKLNRLPTTNYTASAVWILSQLDKDIKEVFGDEIIDNILGFLDKLKLDEDDCIAYKDSENDKDPYVCSTYYADRIKKIFNEKYHIKYSSEEKIKILRFVIKAKGKTWGFRPCINKDYNENLIHTKDSMSLINQHSNEFKKMMEKDGKDSRKFIQEVYNGMAVFLNNNRVRIGGYTIAEKKWFLPKIYAVRLAFNIIVTYSNEFANNFNIKIPNFDYDVEKIADFIFSCFSNRAGAFRGYSYDRKYILDEYIEEFQRLFHKYDIAS